MGNSKKLGLGSSIAICVGLIVATSCLVSLGTGVGLAGKSFILPLFIVMILNMFIAFSFAELNQLMPKVNGGTGQYTLVAVGPVMSMISNISAYVITMVLASTAEMVMCGTVLSQILFPNVDSRVISLIILGVFLVVNLFGVDLFSKVQNLVVILLIGSMAVMGIMGTFKLAPGAAVVTQSAPAVSGVGGVMSLAAIAFWLFIGVEFVIPVAKEMKNPKRDVLLSMILGLVLLFGVQSILGIGMANYVDLSVLSSDATPHMVFAENLAGNFGRIWMGIVTILAAVSTMNTVLASTSKIMQGMAEEGMFPKIFAKTNKHNAAVAGLVLMAGADLVLVVSNLANTNGIVFFILAASCFWLVSYCIVHISVLILRKRYPDMPRNKKLMWGGLPQIIGIIGNVYMIWNIASGETRIQIYEIFGVLFVILIAYSIIWVGGVMKAKPFKPVDINLVNEDAIRFDELVLNNAKQKAVASMED